LLENLFYYTAIFEVRKRRGGAVGRLILGMPANGLTPEDIPQQGAIVG
jgi:hypothetical protein